MKDGIYYFGCIKESGHYLWTRRGNRLYEHDPDLKDHFPLQIHILDGGLIPPATWIHPQGHAFLAHINGWTVISFNDSSVDKRGGSCSAFVIQGIRTFENALAVSKRVYPEIFARFTFEVRLAPTAELKPVGK